MSQVSLILVSHSKELVTGLKDLLLQMQPEAQIAISGGEADGGIGTNAFDIKDAIESVYSEKGSVVFFDLGSARINSELAIEMVEDKNIVLVDAPLVEGAFTAAIEAGFGHDLETVVKAAEKARDSRKMPEDN
ncbi:PTS-dependent dihydroxyacetone kinase phosphotransferase subunit DhaM [Paenalkalicoccus suaedae]|uniref:phosphoenolpyruvate--glycerone phosphotransferase n=1 Tax=Paenalkalicoccus suaedae TaxID=2592382 RepID=A0A859FG42_9BACI|nr:dihydroxyacetone kinase phosphoryl donor subunit DhaM [Paenalkalicoccus suaedae]QKS71788.1 PTS-dependent dihydroxyacetone kinase phosphotransferase subunit DhaM [Paenalkalicoccus suaedae]